jgi:PAS domain S-box-containing protein
MEDAMRDAHQRMENIIEGAYVGTWEWNVQTGETVFNEVWAQIIGYTLDELAPICIKTWEMFVCPDDMKQSAELLERHFAGALPYYDCECRMKHKNGQWVWIYDRGCVINHLSGDISFSLRFAPSK